MKGGYIALDAWKRRLKVDEGQTTADREYDLDTVACVGCCTMAPVTVVDDKPLAQVDTTRVDEILLAFERKRQKRGKRSEQ
jgi:NADH-quinone oxidoreductase subunit E